MIRVRKAAIRDIQPILGLINSYAAEGLMLERTEFDLSENIRDFSVAVDGANIVGCGALHFYTPTMAEIRSLAVAKAASGAGIGRSIVTALEQEARENALEAIFAFTYVTGFFARLGFLEVERGELPLESLEGLPPLPQIPPVRRGGCRQALGRKHAVAHFSPFLCPWSGRTGTTPTQRTVSYITFVNLRKAWGVLYLSIIM